MLNKQLASFVKNQTEAMNTTMTKWVQEENERLAGFSKSLEAAQKNVEKKVNASFGFLDDLNFTLNQPVNFTSLKFTELPTFKTIFNFSDDGYNVTGDSDDDANSTSAADDDDVDFRFGLFNETFNTEGSMFDFDFQGLQGLDGKRKKVDKENSSTWGSNTTECKREKKACDVRCGGKKVGRCRLNHSRPIA
jgi:hypothetical protein